MFQTHMSQSIARLLQPAKPDSYPGALFTRLPQLTTKAGVNVWDLDRFDYGCAGSIWTFQDTSAERKAGVQSVALSEDSLQAAEKKLF